MVKRVLPVAALVMIVVLLALSPALAQDHGVVINDNSYSPANLTIDVGESVGWSNNGQARHSVTADNGSFDSSPSCSTSNESACMAPGATFEHTFNTSGTFGYYCRIHGAPGGQGMSGTVTVQSQSPSPTPTGTVSPTASPTGSPTATPTATITAVPTTTSGAQSPLPETGDSDSVLWMGLALLAFGIGLAGLLRLRAV